MDDLKRRQWVDGELLVCALFELLIVHIAYHIDRQKSAPFLSTAAWAILFGVGVSLSYGCVLMIFELISQV